MISQTTGYSSNFSIFRMCSLYSPLLTNLLIQPFMLYESTTPYTAYYMVHPYYGIAI